jgi:hypothetical protein
VLDRDVVSGDRYNRLISAEGRDGSDLDLLPSVGFLRPSDRERVHVQDKRERLDGRRTPLAGVVTHIAPGGDVDADRLGGGGANPPREGERLRDRSEGAGGRPIPFAARIGVHEDFKRALDSCPQRSGYLCRPCKSSATASVVWPAAVERSLGSVVVAHHARLVPEPSPKRCPDCEPSPLHERGRKGQPHGVEVRLSDDC